VAGQHAQNRTMSDATPILAICGLLERGEIDATQFFERFARLVAAQIGCSRCGVWIFIDTTRGRALRCAAMFDARFDGLVSANDRIVADAPAYFEVLLRDDCVVAPDARCNPATVGWLESYLLPLDIHSLFDLCFSVNGVLFGAIGCEQVGALAGWSQRQLHWLRQMGSRASLTLMRAAGIAMNTQPGPLWESSTPSRLTTMPLPLDPPTE
jgi:hypothetical protein